MKSFIFYLVVTFCAFSLSAQDLHILPAISHQSSLLKLHSDDPRLASAQVNNFEFNSAYAMRGERGSCERYRHMKVAGIVLASVGGGALILGAVMVNVGTADAYNNGFHTNSDWGLIAGGAFFVVGGTACLAAGIPLAIVGAVKSRKTCGGSNRGGAQLILNAGRNGSGLALNF